MTDTKALRGLLEKASKGEWNVSHNTFFDVLSIGAEDLVCNFFVLSEENHKYYPMDDCEANAELIAAMKNSFDGLLDAYEERDRLKAENEKLREGLKPFAIHADISFSSCEDDYPLSFIDIEDNSISAANITVGDLRKVSNLLKGGE